MFRFSRTVVPALALLALAAPSHAQFFNNATGLAAPANTITFSELGNLQGQPITNQFQPFGASFSPALLADNDFFGQGGSTGFSGQSLTNITDQGFSFGPGPFTIQFNGTVTDAAFAIVDQGDTYTFQALLGGFVVDSGSVAVDFAPGSGFVGFQNRLFDAIRFNNTDGTALALDTLQFNPAAPAPGGGVIPEPGTLALAATVLLPLAGAVVRKRRKA